MSTYLYDLGLAVGDSDMLADMQWCLEPAFLTRSSDQIQSHLLNFNLDLRHMIRNRLKQVTQNASIFDIGAGGCVGIEMLVREMRVEFPMVLVNGVGLDEKTLPFMLHQKLDHIPSSPVLETGEIPITECIDGNVVNGINLPDNSQDFGYSVNTFMYIPDPLQVLSEVYRVLKPGGSFVFDSHLHYVSDGPKFIDILGKDPKLKEVISIIPPSKNYMNSIFNYTNLERRAFIVRKKPEIMSDLEFPVVYRHSDWESRTDLDPVCYGWRTRPYYIWKHNLK